MDIQRQRTILIVDDHEHLRSVLRRFLADAFPDCSFREAADGASALEACNESQPALVLMDKCLPDADGIKLTAQLKAKYGAMQVIVISYRTEEVYATYALAAGARAYISKDRIAAELIPAVAAVLCIQPAKEAGAR